MVEGTDGVQHVSPATAQWGDQITIIGKRFGPWHGQVIFGGQASKIYLEWTDTRIVVDVPSSTPYGEVSVEVIDADGVTVLVEDAALTVHNYILPVPGERFVPGQVIVELRPGVKSTALLANSCVISITPLITGKPLSAELARFFIVSVQPGDEVNAIIQLAADPNVESASANSITTGAM